MQSVSSLPDLDPLDTGGAPSPASATRTVCRLRPRALGAESPRTRTTGPGARPVLSLLSDAALLPLFACPLSSRRRRGLGILEGTSEKDTPPLSRGFQCVSQKWCETPGLALKGPYALPPLGLVRFPSNSAQKIQSRFCKSMSIVTRTPISKSSSLLYKMVHYLHTVYQNLPVYVCVCGASVRGMILAGILEWVAISFSRGSSQPRDRTPISCIGMQILYH